MFSEIYQDLDKILYFAMVMYESASFDFLLYSLRAGGFMEVGGIRCINGDHHLKPRFPFFLGKKTRNKKVR